MGRTGVGLHSWRCGLADVLAQQSGDLDAVFVAPAGEVDQHYLVLVQLRCQLGDLPNRLRRLPFLLDVTRAAA